MLELLEDDRQENGRKSSKGNQLKWKKGKFWYMELLYGQQIHFSFTKKDVNELLEREPYYPAECKDRVRDIIFYQMRKYAYLF